MGTLGILLGILIFGVIVGLHELGHFLSAKLFKIKVNEFAIGMGPRLVSKKGKETTYNLRLLPIGGFIEMDEDSLSKAQPYKRLLVTLSGVLANLLTALVVLIVVVNMVGVATLEISDIVPGSPASLSGVKQGDKIVSINKSKIQSWDDVHAKVNDSEGKITLELERDGFIEELEILPLRTEEGQRVLGISPRVDRGVKATVTKSTDSFMEINKDVSKGVGDIATGKVSKDELGGPLQIFTFLGESNKQGLPTVLVSIALISINLAIFNLLPLPVLDGGRALLIVLEMIRGKKLKTEIELGIQGVSMMFLLGLMAYATFGDIRNFF